MGSIKRLFSVLSRKRKIREILRFIEEIGAESILIVGASADGSGYGNMIERAISASRTNVVVSGLEMTSSLWSNWVQADGRALPFGVASFDLVLSNAVIEHVGNREDQQHFAAEHRRVGKRWLLTTPNRLFPVELHSGALFRHMTGKWLPANTSRLLSRRDLRELVGAEATIKPGFLWATFTAYASN